MKNTHPKLIVVALLLMPLRCEPVHAQPLNERSPVVIAEANAATAGVVDWTYGYAEATGVPPGRKVCCAALAGVGRLPTSASWPIVWGHVSTVPNDLGVADHAGRS